MRRESLMGTIDIASLLVLFVVVATAVVACVVIYSRKKRRAQNEAGEAQRKAAEEEQRREMEQEAVRRAEENERQRLEAQRRQIEEKLRKAEEERHKAEEERRRLDGEARREIEEAQQKAKEEEQKRLAAELQKAERERHKAEEERKHLDEEARRKAEVQRQMEELRKAEEERRKGEEAQRTEEEEERPKVKAERKPLEPGKRGGRPSGLTQSGEERPSQETKSLRPKPEIGCWKRERWWILGVEVPEDLLEKPELQVLQNGSPLTQDESSEDCWCLEQVCGQVVVKWNEDVVAKETQIALGEGNYLLFKLCGKNQNLGRRVKSPSLGSYLVMVLDNWDRDEALSGPPPAAPEPVSLAGYRAHFFDLEKDSDRKIVFRAPGGESFVIESKASRFELFGTRLNDANEDIGLLFGGRPPKICTVGDQTWTDVDCIVVLEEEKRTEEKRWRDVIAPDKETRELGLGDKLEERGVGWYSLRIYDKQLGPPVESLDFRFICALKEIRILQPFPLPSEDGHRPVCVEFLHEPGCAVQPADGLAWSIEIECEDDKTILSIPPDPTYDETRWLVGHKGGPQVEVTVQVERLWWAVGEEHNAPSEWEDQLLTLPCNNFAATSAKALWLRLPRRRWADVVSVGFERSKARQFNMKVTEKMLTIPLREFGDSTEVGDREQEHFLKVWIDRANGLVEGVIAIIPAKEPTRIEQESPKSEAKEVCEKRALLNPSMISAPRLATVLTSLRKVTSGPLLVLIKEARKAYPRAHAARRAGSVEFTKNALCVIALALELRGEEQSRILSLKKHWRIKAGLARDEFPEIMNRVRKRYKDINASGARRAGNMYDKRYAE